MFSKYKKLGNIPAFIAASEIKSTLQRMFELYIDLSKLEDNQVDSDEDESDPSKINNQPYMTPRISNHHEISNKLPDRDGKLSTQSVLISSSWNHKFI